MATFDVKVTNRWPAFERSLVQSLTNGITSGLWGRLSYWLLHAVLGMFRTWGGAYGRDRWKGVKPELYGEPRVGTDGKAHGTYSAGTDPLDASGEYKRSFGIIRQSAKAMSFGSRWVRSGLKRILAETMPYREWKDAKSKAHMLYVQRYALPDPMSGQFVTEQVEVTEGWLGVILDKALAASRSAGER